MKNRVCAWLILFLCTAALGWSAWRVPVPVLAYPEAAYLIAVRIPNRDTDSSSRMEQLETLPADWEAKTIDCLSHVQMRRSLESYREFGQELQLVVEDGPGNPKWISLGREADFVRQGNRYAAILHAEICRETLLPLWLGTRGGT